MDRRSCSTFCVWLRAGWLLGAAALVTGCQTIEEIAPPTAWLGGVGGASSAVLESGRHLYLTKCAKCHVAEPVRDYSAREWRELMPEMAQESKMTSEEEAAVLAYVLKARQFVPAAAL